SVPHAPPSAWYLRTAALALLAHPVEAEGIVTLGRQQWPDDPALAYARLLTVMARSDTSEAAPLLSAVRQRWPDGPWDEVEALLGATAAPRAAIDTARGAVPASATTTPAPGTDALLDTLARALRHANADVLAEQAMAMARATSWTSATPATRHAQRLLVSAVFGALSREGGAAPELVDGPPVARVVALLRAGEVVAARAALEQVGEPALRAVVQRVVDVASPDDAPADAPGLPDGPRTLEPPTSAIPSLGTLWRAGMVLLAEPAVDAQRIAGLARRWGTDEVMHGPRLSTGWTTLPSSAHAARWRPSARMGVLAGLVVALVTLSRCVVP
ncbi:MAG: hypothetical protein MUE41_12080, partial [Gemmatimonadaceae bacterium]|nr:hypothetical protein [Gemmatimonadaceae bacterium]